MLICFFWLWPMRNLESKAYMMRVASVMWNNNAREQFVHTLLTCFNFWCGRARTCYALVTYGLGKPSRKWHVWNTRQSWGLEEANWNFQCRALKFQKQKKATDRRRLATSDDEETIQASNPNRCHTTRIQSSFFLCLLNSSSIFKYVAK